MSFGIGGFGNISDMEDGFAPPATPSRIGQQASGSRFNMNVGNNTNVPNIPPPPKKLILTQKLFLLSKWPPPVYVCSCLDQHQMSHTRCHGNQGRSEHPNSVLTIPDYLNNRPQSMLNTLE
ncbi:hypothetical protein Pst134EA_015872 [Puccinia striiformis f. sp. tritici]|uniref:hypothetical protein n=1 Tax=Puccinia striiformis f. sp. tritici TaxID=168172 RepID=UPI00200808DB|nr:hypothetical protein Pst134EA_015872 [Puccinia striiformis f. sp. tritici]KAH9463789.1 hypothetical protein Pst134EA_015872 [Puccinia striiformis f. sp. tritici]